jgi:hypothetical protein
MINFVMPTATNYAYIYAEINLSVVANKFEIMARPRADNDSYTFTKADLSKDANGVFQLKLYRLTITASSITVLDQRTYSQYPRMAAISEYADESGATNGFTSSIYNAMQKMYLRAERLAGPDTSYNAKNLASSVNWTIKKPSSDENIVVVQGMLTCANKYWITAFVRSKSFLGYSGNDQPILVWLRSVNGGTPNTSYGFLSMEFSLSGTTLYLAAFKVNQFTNSYTDSHDYASGCYFALHSVYELVNTDKALS